MLETPFTVTVDKLGGGCTTGVSMFDRAETIRALADTQTKPSDLGRPGHVNPLRARSRGVLRRAGHTEAAVDLARLAGLYPAGALIEIINEDGTMARLPQLVEVAKKFDIKIICIKDLIAYRLKTESIVDKGVEVDMADPVRSFPPDPFPIRKVTIGAYRSDKRRYIRRGTGIGSRTFILVQSVIFSVLCVANAAKQCTKPCK